MSLQRLGIIGAGGIADVALSTLAQKLPSPLAHASILIPAQFAPQARSLLDRLDGALAASCAVRTDLAALLADKPDVVAECASHVAVNEFGPSILESGCDLVVISIGALADESLRKRLQQAAVKGGSRVVFPAGAIGGVDALAAARLSGLESVVYTGRKPPKAWRGTPAEQLLDLETLREPAVFFEGSARAAAQTYPFNANVTATLALAGIGFDATQVRLVADPGVSRNVHEFSVRSTCGDFTMRLEGFPSADNPKTSLIAGYSVARELLNRADTIVI
jgi:aspartate dehydrogenase